MWSGGGNAPVIMTCDPGLNVSIDMAKKRFVRGLGAKIPFGASYAGGIVAG